MKCCRCFKHSSEFHISSSNQPAEFWILIYSPFPGMQGDGEVYKPQAFSCFPFSSFHRTVWKIHPPIEGEFPLNDMERVHGHNSWNFWCREFAFHWGTIYPKNSHWGKSSCPTSICLLPQHHSFSLAIAVSSNIAVCHLHWPALKKNNVVIIKPAGDGQHLILHTKPRKWEVFWGGGHVVLPLTSTFPSCSKSHTTYPIHFSHMEKNVPFSHLFIQSCFVLEIHRGREYQKTVLQKCLAGLKTESASA